MRSTLFILLLPLLAGCESDPDLLCPESPPRLLLDGPAGVHVQVFQNGGCTGCHLASVQDPRNPAYAPGNYETVAATRAAVINKPTAYQLKSVVPGDLSRSVLWLKVLGGSSATPPRTGPAGENVGPEMPEDGRLTAQQLTVLKNWICSGAN